MARLAAAARPPKLNELEKRRNLRLLSFESFMTSDL